MEEVNLFKDYQEIYDFFDGVTLRFNFLSDGLANYKTTMPQLIDGNFVDVSVSFYYEDGKCLHDYENFQNMLNFYLLSEISYLTPENEKVVLYFSKYKEVTFFE